MNVEQIKSELQHVLDSDITLRKEYNEVRRSLGDYRNKLIERDEDCKRLQVSIDVLNTKLAVMERDNVNYKNEVTSFKDLRNTIRKQLQEKQDEISALLIKIEELTLQLGSITGEYEAKILVIKGASESELSTLKANYEFKLADVQSNSTYQQSGIRTELETKINDITTAYNSQHSQTVLGYETKIEQLTSTFNTELETLKQQLETNTQNWLAVNETELSTLTATYETKITQLTSTWNSEKEWLNSSFIQQTEELTTNYSTEKLQLVTSYETTINALTQELATKQTEFDTELNTTISALTQSYLDKETTLINEYEVKLADFTGTSESLLTTLKAEYDERLANTVIHSNEQNSKLTSDLNSFVLENESFKEKIKEMVYHIDAQNEQIELLTTHVASTTNELHIQSESYTDLITEFDLYKNAQLSSIDEQISHLNLKISDLEESISLKELVINELKSTTDEQTNQYTALHFTYTNLQEQHSLLSTSFESEKQNAASWKCEVDFAYSQELETKEVEFKKLLAENTSLINEIDAIADKLELTEEEFALVKSELNELKVTTEAKGNDLRETLQDKNYELTTLSANSMALQTELGIVKAELENVRSELKLANELTEKNWALQTDFENISSIKNELEKQVQFYKSNSETLEIKLSDVTALIAVYQTEIADLKTNSKLDEQDAFIDRLFKQIDVLSDERLNLLNEKEEMAKQLLKMNETVFSISQQVDFQNVNIYELDNHRKNVILAGSSSNGSDEKTIMKKQINELVREIDKCIALLSA